MFWITWFLAGLLSSFSLWAIDMRGKPYNENYYDFGDTLLTILITFLGYISIFITICVFLSKYHFVYRLLYKIANIGIDKEKKRRGSNG